jgi:hypothetical protein
MDFSSPFLPHPTCHQSKRNRLGCFEECLHLLIQIWVKSRRAASINIFLEAEHAVMQPILLYLEPHL